MRHIPRKSVVKHLLDVRDECIQVGTRDQVERFRRQLV